MNASATLVRVGNVIGITFFIGLTVMTWLAWRLMTYDGDGALGHRLREKLSSMPSHGDVTPILLDLIPIGSARNQAEDLLRKSFFRCENTTQPTRDRSSCHRTIGDVSCGDEFEIAVEYEDAKIVALSGRRDLWCL